MTARKQSKKTRKTEYVPPIWLTEALQVLKPPEDLTVSEYADKYRILGSKNAEPGQWKTSRTPYLRTIMDTYNDCDVEDVTFVKPTQVGGTEALNNIIGYAAAQEGASNLVVLPTEELAAYCSKNRIQPMIELNSDLSPKYDKNNSKLDELNFKNEASVYFSCAGSPSDLASKPIKNCFYDEVDKYPPFSGKEADPISLGNQRQMTFKYDKFRFKTSTPTTKQGTIWKSWNAADRRFEFYVPCPHCGHYQTLKFRGGIKWSEAAKTPNERKETAYYECEHCKQKITDQHKQAMIQAGEYRDIATGEVYEKIKTNKRKVAFRINAIYSPWTSFGDVAYEFAVSKDFPDKLMNFVNSWLAEAWEQTEVKMNSSVVLNRQSKFPELIVPLEAQILTAGIDVQRDRFYYTVRGWGAYMTSWNITHGQASCWSELEAIMNRHYEREDGERVQINLAAIDSGDQTDDIYDLCVMASDWLIPVKGSSRPMLQRYKVSMIDKINSKAHGMRLYIVDGGQYKDMIAARLNRPNGRGSFMVFDGCDEEYAEQLCSEEKVPAKNGGFIWQQKSSVVGNHFLDCEVYASAAADVLNVRYLEDLTIQREETQTQKPTVDKSLVSNPQSWIHTNKNWIR